MNNKPVAWMSADGKFNKKETWLFPIPLYTHPVKELTAQEVMEQTHRKISEAHWKVKELTDEEITEIFDTTFEVRDYEDSFIKFARAILRKAQEK